MLHVNYISIDKERGHAEKFGFGSKNISESLDGFKLRRNTDFRV